MKYGDKIKLVNQYEETTFGYLNTWSSKGKDSGFWVSTASPEEVDEDSATWKIVPSNSNNVIPTTVSEKSELESEVKAEACAKKCKKESDEEEERRTAMDDHTL